MDRHGKTGIAFCRVAFLDQEAAHVNTILFTRSELNGITLHLLRLTRTSQVAVYDLCRRQTTCEPDCLPRGSPEL